MQLNLTLVAGRATKDSESFESKSKKTFTKFCLATNEYMGSEKEEKVTFYEVFIFNNTKEAALSNIKKGDMVFVKGKVEAEAYLSKKDKKPKAKLNIITDSWSVIK